MLLIFLLSGIFAAGIFSRIAQRILSYNDALTGLYFNFSLYPYTSIANYIKAVKTPASGLITCFNIWYHYRPAGIRDDIQTATKYQFFGFYINFIS